VNPLSKTYQHYAGYDPESNTDRFKTHPT
jgi:hypothetical protein